MVEHPVNRRRRRRRRRKHPNPIVPIAASETAPPEPGRLEQPPYVKGVGQVHPEELAGAGSEHVQAALERAGQAIDRAIAAEAADDEPDEDLSEPAPRGVAKGRAIMVRLPDRFMEILAWAARERRQSVEDLASELLRGPLAAMKPAWRTAKTGKLGGSVRKEDMAKVLE